MASKRLEVVIVANPKGLASGFGEAERRAGKFDSKMSGISGKLTSTFSTLGKGLGLGAVGGVGLLAAYGPTLVDLGGKLGAWELKANTVFEGQAAAVRKWSDKNNEAFGVTDEELTGLAASFGDLLKPMGFTSSEAADMSTKVVGLAGALSQWSGGKKSASEATDILAKAMLGEREGLVELGIKISENDVQARLAKKGQEGLTGAALEQAKALATQELIFEKSTDAQKAYAAGGNKTLMASNKLKAIFGELQVWLAEKLVPAFTAAATWVGDELPRYIAMGQAAIEGLFGGGGGSDAGTQAQEVFGRIRTAVESVVSWVRDNWPQIKATVSEVMLTVQTVIGSVVSVVQTIWANFGENILTYARNVFRNIQQEISGALEVIRGIFTVISSALKGDWAGVWEGIKGIVHGAVNVVIGIVKNAGELLRLAATVTLEVMNSAWKAGWDAIQQVPGLAWEAIKTGVAWSLQWIVDQVTSMPEKIATAATGMFDGIKEAFRAAINWVIRAWNGLEFKIPGYDPPGPGPKFDGFTLGIPDLPELHTGGRVPGQLGREVPIMALGGEQVLSIPQVRAAESASRVLASSGSLSGDVYVTVQVAGNVTSERDLAKSIAPVIFAEARRQSRMGGSPLAGVR